MKTIPLFLLALAMPAQEYKLGPDSQAKPNVPHGAVTKYTFAASKIYPGTTRDYWVYVPAQYDAAKPACLMVFQDGGGMVGETGAWRVPVVFDNLIADRSMPVTIAVFVNPGIMPAKDPATQQNRFGRSYEYDAVNNLYARFLLEELLPEVGKLYKISQNPDDRALGGSSSGGIAAFVAAWERPDSFHRVFSSVGSYTNLRGGNMLPDLIRKMEPVPLRVFLEDGNRDQSIYGGDWYVANQDMYSALTFGGYDATFVTGTLGHTGSHAAAIFPYIMRWLWRGYPAPIAKPAPKGDERTISGMLSPGHDWEVVSEGHQNLQAAAPDKEGNLFFADAKANKIFKIAPDGKETLFKDDAGGPTGLMFGADGRLFVAEEARKRIVAYSPTGARQVIAEGFTPNDLAVSSKGDIYATEFPTGKIWFIPKGGQKRSVHEAHWTPNGVRFSPDESLLLVADTVTRWVWSFQVETDGSLINGEAYYHLELPDDVPAGPIRSGADGMTLDTLAHVYVTTNMGIQVCDQAGRVVGIIRTPVEVSNLVFGGPDMHTLYATGGGKLYKRVLNRQGFLPWQTFKPPMPHL
jgi:sugar lactone lactonase YvrE/enterochelin esterase-like enzyme